MGLETIERMCWRLSGWQVDQRSVDALLGAIEDYVTGRGAPSLHETATGPQTAAQGRTGPDPRETLRKCRVCGHPQAVTEFYRDVHGIDGRRRECRSCGNERKRNAKRVRRLAEDARRVQDEIRRASPGEVA